MERAAQGDGSSGGDARSKKRARSSSDDTDLESDFGSETGTRVVVDMGAMTSEKEKEANATKAAAECKKADAEAELAASALFSALMVEHATLTEQLEGMSPPPSPSSMLRDPREFQRRMISKRLAKIEQSLEDMYICRTPCDPRSLGVPSVGLRAYLAARHPCSPVLAD